MKREEGSKCGRKGGRKKQGIRKKLYIPAIEPTISFTNIITIVMLRIFSTGV